MLADICNCTVAYATAVAALPLGTSACENTGESHMPDSLKQGNAHSHRLTDKKTYK